MKLYCDLWFQWVSYAELISLTVIVVSYDFHVILIYTRFKCKSQIPSKCTSS